MDNTTTVTETMEEYEVTSTLTLLSSDLSDSGLYECRANNSLGTDSAQAEITVFSKLPKNYDYIIKFT